MLRGGDPSSVFSSSLSVSKISVASDMGRGTNDRLPKKERVWVFCIICMPCGRNSCSQSCLAISLLGSGAGEGGVKLTITTVNGDLPTKVENHEFIRKGLELYAQCC
jgi:hypothetical protein